MTITRIIGGQVGLGWKSCENANKKRRRTRPAIAGINYNAPPDFAPSEKSGQFFSSCFPDEDLLSNN